MKLKLVKWTTGFRSRQRQRILPLASSSRPALSTTRPPVRCVPGPFPGGKARPGRSPDHSPLSSADVNNEY
jgi:hypothetical protein